MDAGQIVRGTRVIVIGGIPGILEDERIVQSGKVLRGTASYVDVEIDSTNIPADLLEEIENGEVHPTLRACALQTHELNAVWSYRYEQLEAA